MAQSITVNALTHLFSLGEMLWVFLIGLVLAGAEVPKGGKEVKKEKEEGVRLAEMLCG